MRLNQQIQTTVHSRYLGPKKPLGGFYHYINIGTCSFFLMFLDEYGIKLYIRDDFPINLCGVEDSMENYQTYLISCCWLWCSSPMECFFFSFCHSYLDLSHDFHAHLCFHSHFIFTAHTSLGCRNV